MSKIVKIMYFGPALLAGITSIAFIIKNDMEKWNQNIHKYSETNHIYRICKQYDPYEKYR